MTDVIQPDRPGWRPPPWLIVSAAIMGTILAPVWMTIEVFGQGRTGVMIAAFVWFAWSGWGVLLLNAFRIIGGDGSSSRG